MPCIKEENKLNPKTNLRLRLSVQAANLFLCPLDSRVSLPPPALLPHLALSSSPPPILPTSPPPTTASIESHPPRLSPPPASASQPASASLRQPPASNPQPVSASYLSLRLSPPPAPPASYLNLCLSRPPPPPPPASCLSPLASSLPSPQSLRLPVLSPLASTPRSFRVPTVILSKMAVALRSLYIKVSYAYYTEDMGAEDEGYSSLPKWRKVAYGGMQPGYDDNYTDGSFLEDMVMNANVVKRDMFKVMLVSVSISQYLSIVAIVACVWTYTLCSVIDEVSLLTLDFTLLALGFLVLFLTASRLSLQLLSHYLLNICFFIGGLYVLAPVYYTLTRSISSDSIWALTVSLLVIHLFLHDYPGSTIRPPGALNNPTLTSNISLNSSIVASVLIASRLSSWLHVFAIMFFSLQVFLFAPFITYCIKRYSFKLHLCLSFVLMNVALSIIYQLHQLLFVLFLCLLIFVTILCPFWLIRLQEYKFEINGPWDEAKLCFDIVD